MSPSWQVQLGQTVPCEAAETQGRGATLETDRLSLSATLGKSLSVKQG